jgi:hypothetical protein
VTHSNEFRLSGFPGPWLGGEPRVFTKSGEDHFPTGINVDEARLIEVQYLSGGIGTLFDLIADAAKIPTGSFQALLENLEDLSQDQPLILFVRGSLQLLADVGPALMHLMTGWESFARHANGVSAMYLVLETGSQAQVDRAFFPGGPVDWLPVSPT